MAFVATSAPAGWKLGRWTQTSQTAWQEEKLDNSKLVYQYQVVSGPSRPGSTTIRLKMKDQNTEVLLLDTTAQVFASGSYLGEYGGEWQGAGGNRGSKGPQRGKAAPPPAQAAAAPAGRAPAVPEQPLTQAAPQQKAAAPKRAPGTAVSQAQAYSPPPVTAAPDRSEFLSSLPEMPQRPQKAQGLDTSDPSMQKLINAAKNGDVAKVKECLDSGIDPDGPAKDGRTPLMAAAGGGHMNAVQALLDACADPTLGKGEETPMTIAFNKGKQDVLKVLFNASFNFLNNAVGPQSLNLPNMPQDQMFQSEVPENAMYELRDITTQIAKINSSKDRPDSPHGKYGNYAQLAANEEAMADHDSDMLRTEAVRLAMKSLSKTK